MSSFSPELVEEELHLSSVRAFSPRRSFRVLERSIRVYRRRWSYVVSGFFEPFFYLLSIGVGIDHLVGSVRFDGHPISYTLYVAPGLLASSAMNGAIFDSTYNLFYKLNVSKIYDAVVATPLTVDEIAVGELGWAVARGAMYSTGFLLVMAGFGLVHSMWALCCLPTAILISSAFGAVGAAVTSFMKSWQSLSAVSLALLPMFLFSGTFFELSSYPDWLGWFVRVTPLYQGVALMRAFDLGSVSPALIVHALYLIAMAVIGLVVASRRLQNLLVP